MERQNSPSRNRAEITAKKRKDKENTNIEQSLQKVEKKRPFSYEWDQDDTDVTITLNISPSISLKNIECECTLNVLSVSLPDGRRWTGNLFDSVINNEIKRHSSNGKFVITLKKQVPGVVWSSLESKSEKNCAPISEEKPYVISHVKNDFIERDLEIVTVYMFVKQIVQDSLQVQFEETKFYVRFQTRDPKFHMLHVDTNENTLFQWCVQLKGAIVPSECQYLPKTQILLEIKLRKRDRKKWGALEALVDEKKSSGMGDPPCNTWIPVQTTVVTPEINTAKANNKGDASTENHTFTKPTCMVSPMNKQKSKEKDKVVDPGLTGLDNIGNTCFMNAVIQCLANTRQLKDYFLDSQVQQEINVNNPLGMQGHLALSFAVLLRVLWTGRYVSYAPSKLKNLVSQKAIQFSGFAQHDAQELMAFLLDGLHEDLNRIKNKALTATVESDGRPDWEIAAEAWNVYKMRNDSIIVDIFQGQYKSKLLCPNCGKVSITFDPFLYLAVPLPKPQKTISLIFFWRDAAKKPMKFSIRLATDSTVDRLRDILSQKTGVPSTCIRVLEEHCSNIRRVFTRGSSLQCISPQESIRAFEVLDKKQVPAIVEISVIQRLDIPSFPPYCAYCKRRPSTGEGKLKRCTKCYRVGYCEQACQRNHWNDHKSSCAHKPEPVGSPFIISLPKSQATFLQLCNVLQNYSRYSVNVFQPPIEDRRLSCGSGGSDLHQSSEESSQEDQLMTHKELPRSDSSSSSGGDDSMSKGKPSNSPLFHVVPVSEKGDTLQGDEGKKINDKGDEPLELVNFPYLAMDWLNNERRRVYCMAESKPLESECEESESSSNTGDEVTLHHCIQLFTEPEVLSSEEAWYCPQCKEHREATKEISLWKLPPVLIVQLKRFSFKNLLWRDKIERMVHFPTRSLDLSPFLSQPCEDGFSALYDLYAVVNHHGGILGGHYTANARCVDEVNSQRSEVEWRLFDDSHVQYVSENTVETNAAYVLFYHRRNVQIPPYVTPNQSSQNIQIVADANIPSTLPVLDSNVLEYDKINQILESTVAYSDDEVD